MRPRVMLPLLLFGLLTVAAVLIPVSAALAESRTQQLALQRTSAMDELVQRAQTAVEGASPAPLQRYLDRFHETFGEAVVVTGNDGDVIARIGAVPTDDDALRLLQTAARGIPQNTIPTIVPWSDSTALLAQPIRAAGQPAGAVLLAADASAARTEVTGQWALIAITATVMLAALLLAANAWTRWILKPVKILDNAALAIADNRDPGVAALSGPPELRHLTRSFERMSAAVSDTLEQQRGFVADASHQLRNPLAAIRLRIDAAEAGEVDHAELARLNADLDRLDHVIARMLALANAENHATTTLTQSAGREDATVTTSASALAGPFRDRIHAAGQIVDAEDDDLVEVPCSADDLQEIVDTVLDNATKYAGAGARIRVELTADPRGVTVRIEDSGPGLDDEDLTRIGTRFWRSRAHQSSPGSGLGIAIVAQLARANGATVAMGRSSLGGLETTVTWGRT
ncbi:HAMP domain-containing sensor histidine kinase [Microbacterium sp. NPDC077184]|uniref:sensor histidine kinase n=1 Tax=Microbacterium sp. NPDC077184 TaxID=3154764 RepID=UPI0034285EE9